MTQLGAAPIEERRIAVASALDIASHRVDAWATGVGGRAGRRSPQRARASRIGAFGYVEDIRLGRAAREPRRLAARAEHSHAVAAGILASAHRSKIGAKAGAQPFAIDLSSRRGVELRRVLEGMQARGRRSAPCWATRSNAACRRSAARFQLTSATARAARTPTSSATTRPAREPHGAGGGGRRRRRCRAAAARSRSTLSRRPPAAAREALARSRYNAYHRGVGDVSPAEWEAVKAAL